VPADIAGPGDELPVAEEDRTMDRAGPPPGIGLDRCRDRTDGPGRDGEERRDRFRLTGRRGAPRGLRHELDVLPGRGGDVDLFSADLHRVDPVDQALADDEPGAEVLETVGARHQGRQGLPVQKEPDAVLDDDVVMDVAHTLLRRLDPGAADDLHHAVSSRIHSR